MADTKPQDNKPAEPAETKPADHDKIKKALAEAPYIVESAADMKKAQEEEYGRYVATEAIDIGGARAFNPGDAVPVEHVRLGIVREDQVEDRKAKTKAS